MTQRWTHTHAHSQAAHTYTHIILYAHNSYLTVIGEHEMHGRMHANYYQVTILLVVDLFIIGLLYDDPTPSHSRQIAYKNLVARQLPTNVHTHL